MSRIYRVTLKGHHSDGTLIEPSLHYLTDVPTTGDEPDPSDVAAGAWSLLGTAYKNTLHSSCIVDDVIVSEQVLAPAIGVTGIHHVGEVGTGFGTTANLPQALVPLVSIHTNVASKSARGHIFLGCPLNVASVDAGKWSSTNNMPFYNAFAALLDNAFHLGTILITDCNPVIYSRTRHRRGETPHFFPVTSATARQNPTWLRSRTTSP